MEEKSQNYPTNYPIKVEISMVKKRFSKPKLFIPRVNGIPSVASGKKWYISFYWRTNPNGPFDKKFTFRKGINRLKTAKERRFAGNSLAKAYEKALERGWNPNTKKVELETKRHKKIMTIQNALEYAFEIKSKHKKVTTNKGYEFHKNRFLDWAKYQGCLGLEVSKFSIDHFYEFLDWIRFEYVNEKTGEGISGTSVNNHKRSLSALFTVLKNERIISQNFIKGIPNVDEDPVNNKAFTFQDLANIKSKLEKEDPYLITFISFMLYPLLRPREICRLLVRDINTENWVLGVETKTEKLSYRRIINKMKPIIKRMQIENFPAEYHLFSNLNRPKPWEGITLKTKVDHFGKRFRKIKTDLGFGREYSLYSFRHTAIMDLYHSMQKKGMPEQEILFNLMPITQHKSVAGLKNYLRNHIKSIPPDHSDIYTLDF